MNPAGCILAAAVSATFAYNQHVLDYSLETVKYLASEHIGLFQCCFYDVSSGGYFEDILDNLAKSPVLQNTVRVIARGPFRNEHKKLPYNPSLLFINSGSDEDLSTDAKRWDIILMLVVFNPTTKVLVYVDFNAYNEHVMKALLIWAKFNYVVFIDKQSGRLRCGSLKNYHYIDGWPHPRSIFEWQRTELQGGVITFVERHGERYEVAPNWLVVIARFLNAKVEKYRGLNPAEADISLETVCFEQETNKFNRFFMTELPRGRILVPIGRALNAVELILMPFDWQVWILLLVVLLLAEVLKRCIPNMLENDPFLLAVCGFERRNLHQAGRREKIILLSLIILMFFVTNAFETKIISLMIDRPSTQRIKTLDDLEKHGIHFLADLANTPEAVDNPVIGRFVVNGSSEIWETLPGVALYVSQDVADLVSKFSFDFERGQPWFDVLDLVITEPVLFYRMAFRSPLFGVFQTTYLGLIEAGLLDLWKEDYHTSTYRWVWGRRPRKVKEGEIYLNFSDMLPAWIVAAFGLSLSFVGFLGEFMWKKCGTWLAMNCIRK